MTNPILFLFFNRPYTTQKVFQSIQLARPRRLYLACDGPRSCNLDDQSNISICKSIVSHIDWDCKVETLYRETNLGCKLAVSSAISWFFSHESQGLILEDDCLPSKSFFTFCDHMLNKYSHDPNIWHISGASLFPDLHPRASHHVSIYPGIWGWATWANRWENYSLNFPGFSDHKSLRRLVNHPIDHIFWSNLFSSVKYRSLDTWDYQWLFTIWLNNGFCITPNSNLISNIGFDSNATHTTDINSQVANRPLGELPSTSLPLVDSSLTGQQKDDLLRHQYFSQSFSKRISSKLKSIFAIFPF
ncbi:nucleotide-diphospho-sugar transferase [Synechococcus sp. Minos11]|uniref:nucleotide-diphospho-sugar transferase n=1 Tax=Synechococcus sp. Minos11 TaxID=221341 RepID=UPI00164545B9|nr:nucleotide-diphospho-sugar transferase [Synechococcus sp. Minos11]QNJ07693.1 nucleotide-diphospho-sugar transferase [Synechococcus sp. Minos11]